MKKKEIIYQTIEKVGITSALFFLLKTAIDRQTSQSLYERAGNRCEGKQRNSKGKVIGGRCKNKQNLEVAHKKHGKTKRHNRLENLNLYCTCCHYWDHKLRSRNGLSKGENHWTLYQLWNRLPPSDKTSIPEPPIPKKNNKYRR